MLYAKKLNNIIHKKDPYLSLGKQNVIYKYNLGNVCIIQQSGNSCASVLYSTGESGKFEVLGTRDFISKYQKFE